MASSSEPTQNATIMPLFQLSNPNEKKNRVPTGDELQGLRTLMASNSRIDEFLETQIFQLRTSHQTLSARFSQLQRELEATQSQFYETEKAINALLEQQVAVKQRTDHLKGLANPLRRFPVELLRNIFEMAVTASQPCIWEAIRIASVCKLWRDVALDAPRLWTTIQVTPFSSSEDFWNHLRPRLKSLPVELQIESIYGEDLDLLQRWHLPMVSNLQTLRVLHHPALPASALLDHLFGDSYTPLIDLSITIHCEEDNGEGDMYDTELPYSTIVDQFPSLIRLHFKSMGPSTFLPSVSSILSTLILEEIKELNLSSLFHCFHSLETLKLSFVDWMEPEVQTDIQPLNLKSLVLVDTPLFSDIWAGNIRFPSLEHLYYDGDSTETFKAFVVSHPTLKDLDCNTEGDDVKLYATALPGLVRLVLTSSFDAIANWRGAGLLEAPFPSLRVLVFCGDFYTLPELEELVRVRCLPSGHPLSRLEHPSLLVELSVESDADVLGEPFWSQNELLRSASREVIPYPEGEEGHFLTILRWD